MVAELSTSAAHRERVFLEERLSAVKHDLDDASQKFSQFASKNTAIDIKEQGRAMVDAASKLQGEMIAAESELKGLEQIYMPNNVRVRSVQARISELQQPTREAWWQTRRSRRSNGSILRFACTPRSASFPSLGVDVGRSLSTDANSGGGIRDADPAVRTRQSAGSQRNSKRESAGWRACPGEEVVSSAHVDHVFRGVFVSGSRYLWSVFLRAQWNETDDKDPGKVVCPRSVSDCESAYALGDAEWFAGSRDDATKTWRRLARSQDARREVRNRLEVAVNGCREIDYIEIGPCG